MIKDEYVQPVREAMLRVYYQGKSDGLAITLEYLKNLHREDLEQIIHIIAALSKGYQERA